MTRWLLGLGIVANVAHGIGGDVRISGLRSCWLGALRNDVRENIIDRNYTMADPDANEFLANVVHGSIACFGNTPAVQYGDSRRRARTRCVPT